MNDEPSILFINGLGNNQCKPESRMDPLCNIVATVGNHEFDKGQKAMFDLIYGTNNPPTDSWIHYPIIRVHLIPMFLRISLTPSQNNLSSHLHN
ncbi:hypothetical protein PGH43_00740 [Legionella pneumophila 130b]|nr:hypothetical protein PGH43_00740 [Legionella pneumophila 130b]